MTDLSLTGHAPNPLGRIVIPDARDANYPVSAVLPDAVVDRDYQYWWQDGWWGDQTTTPHCVAYAWLHWAEDGPTTIAPTVAQPRAQHDAGAILKPSDVYKAAQLVDQWPGESYDGTSVRAGAKVLQEAGLLSSYRWATTVEEVANAVLIHGPVIIGSTWWTGLDDPDSRGFIWPTGRPRGGHAYEINGVNRRQEKFRVKNSWGRSWVRNGTAWMSYDTLGYLLDNDGEACLPMP